LFARSHPLIFGFPESDILLGGAVPTKYNVVMRYHGTGVHKPILLLAHIDVVEAKREDRSMDPFQLIEKDGYFYNRGTSDDKAQAAIWVANLIRYKQEGFRPDRDLILALTADEEGGGPYNGVDWLLKNHRDLIDSDFALNEGGKGEMINGKRIANEIGLAEKTYADFRFEVRNKGGHSSRPVPDNAIYHLAAALDSPGNTSSPFSSTMSRAPISRNCQRSKPGRLQPISHKLHAAINQQWSALPSSRPA
jgi:acetylornithine deacetylase/succinyl-diaminopimelate desuccinylase-like protein